MKAIVLAGGHGTRLRPLTQYCNKHLLPIYHMVDGKPVGTPIIDFALQALKDAGIKEVAIVLGDFRCEDIFSYLRNGADRGMNLAYFWQGEPLGIAHAVTCAKEFVENDTGFIVYLGDNVFTKGIKQFVENCVKREQTSITSGLLFAHTLTPERFGCPVFEGRGKNRKLVAVVEKPKKPQQPLATTGCYYFNSKAYFTHFEKLRPSARGEYEISDLITTLIKDRTEKSYWEIYDGFWSDAGTFESIKEVEKHLTEEKAKPKFAWRFERLK